MRNEPTGPPDGRERAPARGLEEVQSDFGTWRAKLLLLVLALFLVALSSFPLSEPDALLHLHRGIQVLDHGFGAVRGGDWFHDVVLALAFRGYGTAGIVALRGISLLLFGILVFGFLLARRISPEGAALLLAVSVVALVPVLTAGPGLSGALFVAGLLFILSRGRDRGSWWVLTLLFPLWANVSGETVATGLVAALAFAAGEAVDGLWEGRREMLRAAKGHALGTACGGVLCAVNPVFLSVFRAQAASPAPASLFGTLILAAMLLAVAGGLRDFQPGRLPQLLTGTVMGLTALTAGGPWIVAFACAWPFLMPALLPSARRPVPEAVGWAVPALLVLLAVLSVGGRGIGLGLDESRFPREAVRTVVRERLPGPVGTVDRWIGYASLRLVPNSYRIAGPEEARLWISPVATPPPKRPGDRGWTLVRRDSMAALWMREESPAAVR